jgi:SAM-dependent methyltransferase
MADPREFWNHRYAMPGFAYGTEPNPFLKWVAATLQGPVLCLGEGEGRNAVYLAGLGREVTALDLSPLALEKAQGLARERGVTIHTVEADLAMYEFSRASWGAVVSIWCHLPGWLRKRVHRAACEALVPGGRFVVTAYTPEQLQFDTGGPKSLALLVEPNELRAEIEDLVSVEHFFTGQHEVHEGEWHRGTSAVVELVARR